MNPHYCDIQVMATLRALTRVNTRDSAVPGMKTVILTIGDGQVVEGSVSEDLLVQLRVAYRNRKAPLPVF